MHTLANEIEYDGETHTHVDRERIDTEQDDAGYQVHPSHTADVVMFEDLLAAMDPEGTAATTAAWVEPFATADRGA